MICSICKKSKEETTLYPGILRSEMVNICEECAEDQKIPIIKKPSQTQLIKADKTYSVRERLDKMSGRRDTSEISSDQMTTQRNLTKLKMPKPKQNHPEVLENYYWILNMARRRSKMTLSQLATKVQTSSYVIQEIEKGIIPEDFKEIFTRLEVFLGIKLLKTRSPEISFTRKLQDQEKEILDLVAEKMKNSKDTITEDGQTKEIGEKTKIEEISLPRKENLENVTLNDLIDRKRAREKYKMQLKQNEILGDEIDINEL